MALGNDVVYEFTTADQSLSDLSVEQFEIQTSFQLSLAQAQLFPPSTSSLIPRFDDPLKPAIGTPADQIALLAAQVDALVTTGFLRPREARLLGSDLQEALKKLQVRQRRRAILELLEFIHHVRSFISPGCPCEKDPLIALIESANRIIQQLLAGSQ